MRRYLLSVLLFPGFLSGIAAQDVILKTDGTEVRAKVAEVSESEVRYRKESNLSGPMYVMPSREIFMITYENGEKDVFERKNSGITINHIAPPATPKPAPVAPKPAVASATAATKAATQPKVPAAAPRPAATGNARLSVKELGFELPQAAAGEKIYIGKAVFKNTAEAWALFVLSADRKTIHHIKVYLEEVDAGNNHFQKIEVENPGAFSLTGAYTDFNAGGIRIKRLNIGESKASATVGYTYEETNYSSSSFGRPATKHDLGESEVHFIVLK